MIRRSKNNSNKTNQHRSISSPSLPSDEPQQCVVCLDAITERGKIPVCQHLFCYTCIFEWSKNTNTCPLCKKRFRCITKVSSNGPSRKVRVTDKNQSEHLDDASSLVPDNEFMYDSDSSSLNGFIVSDNDDTYTPLDSSHDIISDNDETFISSSTPLRHTRNTRSSQPHRSPPVSLWQPSPTPVSSFNETSDDDLIVPTINRKRRVILSPLTTNDIHSPSPRQPSINNRCVILSPLTTNDSSSPWQPAINNRCIVLSSPNNDDDIHSSPSSSWQRPNRTRRAILSPPIINDIHSSPISPWQPLIRNRASRRTIKDSSSSSSEDEKEEELVSVTKSSGWLSSRQLRSNNKAKRRLRKRKVRYNTSDHNYDTDDSEWTPPNNL